MNPEILISKYIDGELSHEEDATLRRILKDDNLSREKFDSSVELHLEMTSDAKSIEVPPELLSNTEDMLLMKILGSAPQIHTLKPERKNFRAMGYSVAASLLIALFLSAALQIGDGIPPKSGLASDNSSPKSIAIAAQDANHGTMKKITKAKVLKNKSSVSSIAQTKNRINAISTASVSSEMNSHINNIKSTPGDLNLQNISGNRTVEESNKNIGIDGTVNRISVSTNTKSTINLLTAFNQTGITGESSFNNHKLFMSDNIGDINFEEVKLTTIISQSFALGGFKTSNGKPAMNYSQSISYSIDPDNQIGVEFGLMEFSTNYVKYLAIPGGGSGHGGTEVLEPSSNDGTYLTIKVNGEGTNRLFWGTAFYERNFLRDASGFYLDGRAGIGSINQGFLGYMRITAKYEFINGVMLTAGSESRLMITDFPGYERNLKSLFGLVYGIQFKF